ncbi:hypothetical protein DH2020_043321 [Rehmannia glutinosa]|uniref:GATA-type domain-containing protein n=1 Tax=Rehmannia glutinosa TaxID=99300 RepID=A0ABR0UK09_REHGL
MEILDTTAACFVVDDDLLNFTLDGEGDDEEDLTVSKGGSTSSSSLNPQTLRRRRRSRGVFSTESGGFSELSPQNRRLGLQNRRDSEFVEEELEWLSNKDAFPAVETCFGILSDNPELISNHQSPISVLENSTSSSNSNSNTNSNNSSIASCCNSLKVPTNYPVRARSKRRRRRSGFGDMPSQHCSWLTQVNVVKNKRDFSFALPPLPTVTNSGGAGMGRRCLHCQADKTPQWRAGPMGPKNAVQCLWGGGGDEKAEAGGDRRWNYGECGLWI